MNLTPAQIKIYYYIIVYLIELIRKYGKKAPKDKQQEIERTYSMLLDIENQLGTQVETNQITITSEITQSYKDLEDLKEVFELLYSLTD